MFRRKNIRSVIVCTVLVCSACAFGEGIIGWGQTQVGMPDPNTLDIAAVDAGGYHSVGIKCDGSIIAWGDNDQGQATVPEGNEYIVIAAGSSHSLALKEDGSIVGWGSNDYGQATAPEGNDFVDVSAGGNFSLALREDGSIVGFGYNFQYQASPPEGNDFVAIDAGGYHAIALTSDGFIVGWGSGHFGQLTIPAGNDFTAIAAGFYHNVALRSDGSVVAWGWDAYGQAVAPEGNDFVAIAAGYFHSLALKADGTVVAWGNDMYGQGTAPEVDEKFIGLAGGLYQSIGIYQTIQFVEVDIKPGTSNNKVTLASRGHIKVAILGSEELDVTQIDPNTIMLAGVAHDGYLLEDVAASIDDTEVAPREATSPDGAVDMILKFKLADITAQLEDPFDGQEWDLILTGKLKDGTEIEGVDLVVINEKVQKPDKPDKPGKGPKEKEPKGPKEKDSNPGKKK